MTAQAGRAKLWALRLVLVLPALVVALAAAPRLVSGLVQEAVFPVPAYLVINAPMPQRSYGKTAVVLAQAPLADGEIQALRAEAALRGGVSAARAAPVAEAALARAPAYARGWITLAALLTLDDPKRAAAALALSVEIAPHEYYLIAPRVLAAAPLWAELPQSTRVMLLDDTRTVIEDRSFHRTLLALLGEKGGPALVTRALAGHPHELRALNRALARERLFQRR